MYQCVGGTIIKNMRIDYTMSVKLRKMRVCETHQTIFFHSKATTISEMLANILTSLLLVVMLMVPQSVNGGEKVEKTFTSYNCLIRMFRMYIGLR